MSGQRAARLFSFLAKAFCEVAAEIFCLEGALPQESVNAAGGENLVAAKDVEENARNHAEDHCHHPA